MSTQDTTELMLREYLIDNYATFSDITEFRIDYTTHECSWDVKAYYAFSSEKLIDITVTSTDISVWLWVKAHSFQNSNGKD